jgi:hypothetical protein
MTTRSALPTGLLLAAAALAACAAPPADPPAGMSWKIEDTWKNVKADKTGKWPQPPDLSGYRHTTGAVTAGGEPFHNEGPDRAFDGNPGTKWCVKGKSSWIQYAYPEKARRTVAAYAITTANDTPARDPRDWRLLGSNDGAKWDVVDERRGETWFGRRQTRLFAVKTPGAYGIYKLDIAANHGDVSSQLAEIALLVKKGE